MTTSNASSSILLNHFFYQELTTIGRYTFTIAQTATLGAFSAIVIGSATYTLETAIDARGMLVKDPKYQHYTITSQDSFTMVAMIVVEIHSISAGGMLRFECKTA